LGQTLPECFPDSWRKFIKKKRMISALAALLTTSTFKDLCFVMIFAGFATKTHAQTAILHYYFPRTSPGVINMIPFQGIF